MLLRVLTLEISIHTYQLRLPLYCKLNRFYFLTVAPNWENKELL